MVVVNVRNNTTFRLIPLGASTRLRMRVFLDETDIYLCVWWEVWEIQPLNISLCKEDFSYKSRINAIFKEYHNMRKCDIVVVGGGISISKIHNL